MPNNTTDEVDNKKGDRIDGRNLIEEWKTNMKNQNKRYKYLTSRQEFNNLNYQDLDFVLGMSFFKICF